MKTNLQNTLFIIALLFASTQLGAEERTSSQPKQSGQLFETKFTAAQLNNAPVKLIPYPQHVVWKEGTRLVGELHCTMWDELSSVLQQEIEGICTENQIRLSTSGEFTLGFSKNENIAEEGYALKVDKSGIEIEASTQTGFFYAVQTLRQLIERNDTGARISFCNIEDQPQFPIRGFMIDVGRNFQSIELLKKQLDIMAQYKLNTFHWHLTDHPAWRIESKMYPQLTDAKNHRPSRNPGKHYTYEEIREFINYARKKHISVIPEIDMPGHSDSFIKSMGCKMESPEGMKILENVLHEFFSEIPKDMAPLIHIGSDEVRIKNPEEFISKMVGLVEDDGRKAVVWSPGLKVKNSVIKQAWGEKNHLEEGYAEIDSKFSYINNGEPMSFINKLFFRPIGQDSKNTILGGIICLWPDVNVWSETDIYRQHPVYSALLTYAWTTWTADVVSSPKAYQSNLPLPNTEAANYFEAYEHYLMAHKRRYFSQLPFPYYIQSDKRWQVIGPFNANEGDFVVKDRSATVDYKNEEMVWKDAGGNSLTINSRDNNLGHYPKAKAGQTVYARTYIHCNADTSINAFLNFESPLRANRAYTGIAQNGSWDSNGGEIWVNDEKLKGPKWENPGWKPFKQKGWATGIDKEIPWTDEELYWLRKPAHIALKKGWNKVVVKIPSTAKNQNWMFTFVPLDGSGLRFATYPSE